MNGFVLLSGALAWPMATLGIVLMFRHDLKAMLARVGRVKYRDVEVTFRDDLRQAEVLARSVPAQGRLVLEVEPGGPGPDFGGAIIGGLAPVPRPEGLDRLAARSPRDAVLEAWSAVGKALLKAAATLGDRRAPAPTRAEDAARFLADRGWLAGPEAQLVESLRRLRDRVADHDDLVPSAEEARRFVDLALPLAARVEKLG